MTAMMASNAGAFGSMVRLPVGTTVAALADACREAVLLFVDESLRWQKAELAMWLWGPYSELACRARRSTHRSGSYVASGAPLLREIDARTVERSIRSARGELLAALGQTLNAERPARFVMDMLVSGFVMRCEDQHGVTGWAPTTEARRLGDRVLSLVAADYVMRPSAYARQLSVCPRCLLVGYASTSRELDPGTCRERSGSSRADDASGGCMWSCRPR